MSPEQIEYVISNYLFHILVGLFVLIVGLFVVIVIQGIMIDRMKTLYKSIFHKNGTDNIDDVLIKNKKSVDNIISEGLIVSEDIKVIKERLATKMSKTAVLKYNAFDNMAGNLSFVYVMLNDLESGLILNGIHSNEGHYLYLKEVIDGKSSTLLSKEESETLLKAKKV